MQIYGYELNKEQIEFLKGCKYLFWWQSLEEMLEYPEKVLVHVMDRSRWADWSRIESLFPQKLLVKILENASPGDFDIRSWHFWHYRLTDISSDLDVPPQPVRKIPESFNVCSAS